MATKDSMFNHTVEGKTPERSIRLFRNEDNNGSSFANDGRAHGLAVRRLTISSYCLSQSLAYR